VPLGARLLLCQCPGMKAFSERTGLMDEKTTEIDVGIVAISN
jgi:hypothetical protein